MRLQKVLNILGQMPKKSQKVVMAVVDFDKMTPSENFTKIIDAMIACREYFFLEFWQLLLGCRISETHLPFLVINTCSVESEVLIALFS